MGWATISKKTKKTKANDKPTCTRVVVYSLVDKNMPLTKC
jgi:hypothetical protein